MPEHENACIFCRLIAGELPVSIVEERDDVLAVMDIQPVNPGHVLVFSKVHAPYLADIPPHLAARMFSLGMQVAAALRTSDIQCEGVNFFLADGEAAGQEIFHAHLHVFPRFKGDGFGLQFSPRYFVLPSRSELDEVAERLRHTMRT